MTGTSSLFTSELEENDEIIIEETKTGTGTIMSGLGSTINGFGTSFTSQLDTGMTITAGGQDRVIGSIPSSTAMGILSPAFSPLLLGQTFTYTRAGSGTISSVFRDVIGTGTSFTTELSVGDTITSLGQSRNVYAITDNTHLETSSAFDPLIATQSFTYTRAGTGTIASTGTTVSGLSTVFSTELAVSDTIVSSGQSKVIDTITDADTMDTTVAFSPTLEGQSFTYEDPQSQFVDEITDNTNLTTKLAFSPVLSSDDYLVPNERETIENIILEIQDRCRDMVDNGVGNAIFVESSTDTTGIKYHNIIGDGEVGGLIDTSGTVTSSGTTLTGVGTYFGIQVNVGDIIASGSATPGNEFREVISISSDTKLVLDEEFNPIMSADSYTVVRGFGRSYTQGPGYNFYWYDADVWERLRAYIDKIIYARINGPDYTLGGTSNNKYGAGDLVIGGQDSWDAAIAASPTTVASPSAYWESVNNIPDDEIQVTFRDPGKVTFDTTAYSGAFVSGTCILPYTYGGDGNNQGSAFFVRISSPGDTNINATISSGNHTIPIGGISSTNSISLSSDKVFTALVLTSVPSTQRVGGGRLGITIGSPTFNIDMSTALTDQA